MSTDPQQGAFSSFVLGLASQAMFYLGAMPDPETNEHTVSLPMAQQFIDTIAMLQVKTKGNLTPEEAALVEKLLYDLRLRFVQASKNA